MGIGLSPVYEYLKAQGVLRNGRRKYRWDLMNWELPSGVLQRIWRLPLNMAATYRYRNRLAAPKWPLVSGPGGLQRRGELRAYNRAVKAEERKAAIHYRAASKHSERLKSAGTCCELVCGVRVWSRCRWQ